MEKRRYPTLLLLITLLLSTLMLHANSTTQAPITAHKLKRMDQQLTHRKTTPKHFKSQREFEQMKRRHHRRTSTVYGEEDSSTHATTSQATTATMGLKPHDPTRVATDARGLHGSHGRH